MTPRHGRESDISPHTSRPSGWNPGWRSTRTWPFAGSAAQLRPLARRVHFLAGILVGIASLVIRYRRAAEMQRRQLLWLLLATLVALIFTPIPIRLCRETARRGRRDRPPSPVCRFYGVRSP